MAVPTPILLFTNDAIVKKPSYEFFKRIADFVLGSILLLLLFPLFLAVTIAIIATDGMPILFKHRRIGKDGREFYVLKFRTMRTDAEQYLAKNPELMLEFQKSFKLDEDPRITRLGRWLRAYSLDELPQLLNVVMGDMSLVGPRPIVEAEVEKYGSYARIYFSVKPGCAGLWQCSGRSDTSYAERVDMDVEYARKASILFDAGIFFKTMSAIVKRQGAR